MANYVIDDDKLKQPSYSKSEMDALIANKANATHTHAIGDVTNLQNTLNGKAASTHRHPFSQIDGLAFALSGTTLYITKN